MIFVLKQINDLKQARNLASEITQTGATLFDLLGKEIEMKVRMLHIYKMFLVTDSLF